MEHKVLQACRLLAQLQGRLAGEVEDRYKLLGTLHAALRHARSLAKRIATMQKVRRRRAAAGRDSLRPDAGLSRRGAVLIPGASVPPHEARQCQGAAGGAAGCPRAGEWVQGEEGVDDGDADSRRVALLPCLLQEKSGAAAADAAAAAAAAHSAPSARSPHTSSGQGKKGKETKTSTASDGANTHSCPSAAAAFLRQGPPSPKRPHRRESADGHGGAHGVDRGAAGLFQGGPPWRRSGPPPGPPPPGFPMPPPPPPPFFHSSDNGSRRPPFPNGGGHH